MDENVRVARGRTWFGPTQTIPSTYTVTEGLDEEGKTATFPYTSPSAKTARQNAEVVGMRLMRNVSGVTLYAGMVVRAAAGYELTRFDGLANETGIEVAGVIDDHLGAGGVRNGDLCWVHRKGPVMMKSHYADVSADVAIGDLLYALTSATSNATTSNAGRFAAYPKALTFTATQTTDGTAGKVLANHFARARSARLTNATNTDTLADMCLPA